MAWVESTSPSFRARHESKHADEADRVLHSLERTRARLGELFPRTLDDLTVVMHRSTVSLIFANPLLGVTWLTTDPAARRYIGGRAGDDVLHMLAPSALESRASKVSGSRQMLELTAPALYTRRVIRENNRELAQARAPARVIREMRWAWLVEGSARWFSGQTDHARPAIARRLHEGSHPEFPPSPRDAALLGGTVIDLLVREEGELAAVDLALRLHPHGARAALSRAFRGASILAIEGEWRAHLARLAGAA